jgi:hypothetical protein
MHVIDYHVVQAVSMLHFPIVCAVAIQPHDAPYYCIRLLLSATGYDGILQPFLP